MDQTNAICHGSIPLSNNSSQSNINTTSASTACTSSWSDENNVIDHNRKYMDQKGFTNTGIVSNEISDNVYGELCGFPKPHLIDNSDKIFEPYIGCDNDSYTRDNDESKIGHTDNRYQHMLSGESNSSTHFVKIKSEPNTCVNSSNHATETEGIGSPRSDQNDEVSIKMEPITCDAFDPSCCMPTDKLTHKSETNSLHVHEQLDRLSSNSTNYAICIKYEPDSGTDSESHTSVSIASLSSSEVKTNSHQIRDNSYCYGDCSNISDNVLNRGHQQRCGPIKIEINNSRMWKDSIAPTSPHHTSSSDNSVETFYHDDKCYVSYEQLHSSHKNVNMKEGEEQGEKPLTPKQHITKEKYTCDVCSYSTISSSLFKRHKIKHIGEKPYKCEVCSYSTTRSTLLAEHRARHTGEKLYKCDVCSFSAGRHNNLVRHMRKHTGEKLYKCDACSYSTTRSDQLADHKRKHTVEKPYKCDVCKFSTARPRDLVRHKRTHTGEKRYKCDVCSYTTARSDNLAVHQARHTGKKSYKCDICSFGNVKPNNLVRHKKKHTGEKPYKCDVCSYSSVRSRDLVRHKRKHTGQKP